MSLNRIDFEFEFLNQRKEKCAICIRDTTPLLLFLCCDRIELNENKTKNFPG